MTKLLYGLDFNIIIYSPVYIYNTFYIQWFYFKVICTVMKPVLLSD